LENTIPIWVVRRRNPNVKIVWPASTKIHPVQRHAVLAQTVNQVTRGPPRVLSALRVNSQTVAMLVKIATVVIFPEMGLGSARVVPPVNFPPPALQPALNANLGFTTPAIGRRAKNAQWAGSLRRPKQRVRDVPKVHSNPRRE
jgi:hypothetical protein